LQSDVETIEGMRVGFQDLKVQIKQNGITKIAHIDFLNQFCMYLLVICFARCHDLFYILDKCNQIEISVFPDGGGSVRRNGHSGSHVG